LILKYQIALLLTGAFMVIPTRAQQFTVILGLPAKKFFRNDHWQELYGLGHRLFLILFSQVTELFHARAVTNPNSVSLTTKSYLVAQLRRFRPAMSHRH